MKNLMIILFFLSSFSAFASSSKIKEAMMITYPEIVEMKVKRKIFEEALVGVLYPYTYIDGRNEYRALITYRDIQSGGVKNVECDIVYLLNKNEIYPQFCGSFSAKLKI